jgi:hypothetical protein
MVVMIGSFLALGKLILDLFPTHNLLASSEVERKIYSGLRTC